MKHDYSYTIKLSEEEVRFLEKEMEREISVIEDFKELKSIAEKIEMLDDIRTSCVSAIITTAEND